MKTFKSILLVAILAALLGSCKTTQHYYYQITQTKPLDESVVKCDNNETGYYYQDLFCRIEYDFWDENGDAGFVITNLSDHVLYVLKDKCFFIKNGMCHPYFRNKTFVETTNGKSTQTPEARVIGIAPHSSVSIRQYEIYSDVFVDCDLNRKPVSKGPATMTFTPQTTPLTFGNYITYKVSENGQERGVSNMFYTSRITNYLKTDLFVEEKRYNCPNVSDTKEYIQTLMRFAPTTGFYVTYIK